jgi:hypothetical protein
MITKKFKELIIKDSVVLKEIEMFFEANVCAVYPESIQLQDGTIFYSSNYVRTMCDRAVSDTRQKMIEDKTIYFKVEDISNNMRS